MLFLILFIIKDRGKISQLDFKIDNLENQINITVIFGIILVINMFLKNLLNQLQIVQIVLV